MKLTLITLFLALVGLPVVPMRAEAAAKPVAEEVPTDAERALKTIVDRQQALLTIAATKTSQSELEDMRVQFQQLTNDYEDYLGKYPNLSVGYVSYALFLAKPMMGERKRAAALMLKANRLNPDLPVVKNQLGNYLVEEGKPIEALNYYLAAVKLAPKEPLYHYQIGVLIAEARDDFLKAGEWTRAALDKSMQDAFEQAMVLSPGNIPYAYRYCESFYDLAVPEWEEALTHWRTLEEKVPPGLAKETIRLHEANILIKQGGWTEARSLLLTVQDHALQAQKRKLVAELEGGAAKK